MTTYENTAVTLAVQSGYTLGLAPGTKKVVTDIKGWYPGTPLRRERVARLAAHGNFAERGYREARFPSIGGTYTAETRAEAAAFVDEINAFLGDGTAGTLTVDDADLGVRSAQVYLMTPDVIWDGGLDVTFFLDMEAPDPRKYGAPVSAATGVAAGGGGLVYPLFSGGLGGIQRTNRVSNPSFENGTGFTAKAAAITLSTTTFASAVVNGSNALSISIGAGAGTFTYLFQNVPATEGEWLAFAAMIRWSSGSRYVKQSIQWRGDAGAITRVSSSSFQPSNNSTGGSRHVYSALAPAGTTSADIMLYFYNDSAGAVAPTSGTTFHTDAWIADGAPTQAEAEARVATYFDGDTLAPGKAYRWTGASGASLSSEYDLVRSGVLDFGTPGSDGSLRVTNTGTADTPVRLTVRGPVVDGFTITEQGSGRQLVYTGEVLDGQYVVLDSRAGTVKLNGYADRAALLTRRDWVTLTGGETAVLLFDAPGSPDARLETEVSPAWW